MCQRKGKRPSLAGQEGRGSWEVRASSRVGGLVDAELLESRAAFNLIYVFGWPVLRALAQLSRPVRAVRAGRAQIIIGN